MQDKELYEQLLGLKAPLTQFACPECGKLGPVYDHRHRRWRHLDTCGLVTMIEADVPRISCKEHGVRQVQVPWAEYAASRILDTTEV